MTLNTRVDVSIGSTLQSALDLSSEGRVALSMAKSLTLSSGTGAGQADQLWFDKRTIGISSNDDLDLAGGLTNGLNQTVTFARVKGMFIHSLPANLNVIAVGGGSNPFINWVGAAGDILNVRPGGFHFLYAPDSVAYVVTPTTADILRLANGAGATVEYEIILFGATA